MGTAPNAAEPSTRRRRILFIAEAVTLAHVVRPLVLARSLDPSRYEVHFACDPRYNKLLGTLPFPHHPIGTIPSERFLGNVAQGRFYTGRTLRRYVEEDSRVLAAVAPDLVVGDLRISLSVSARLAGIPYVAIANAYWSPYARRRFPLPDVLWTHLLGVQLVKLLYRLERPVFFAMQCVPLNRVRREHGLPSLGWNLCRIFTDGDHTLYADLPELVPTDNLPANHRYLGPVLWSPDVAPPAWWESLPTDRPIVYATLGSSGGRNLLQVVLTALAELPVTVIAATAGRSDLTNVPANAFVADYLPGEAAAARSAVVICNGGSMTTQQALVAGVPVIGIASNLDQHLNMEAIERAGAGVLLRTERLTSRRVAEAVQQALTGSQHRHAAGRLAEAFSRSLARFPQQVESGLRPLLETVPADRPAAVAARNRVARARQRPNRRLDTDAASRDRVIPRGERIPRWEQPNSPRR
ncbi:glycosyltransferase [Mycobacterium shinjukuense]|uniref:PGL/p-HBAD biosynthesis rhamnosyltransferase n=1 Tax=Mycobacterium shinjukuense TaxID=398694 RepID=A0A7I7MND6_9MYCO|nr:glycosyltransferase [Mycobacterium shinjukuense]BBX72809.1 PGL/p-HBAD biosynthesis rhamnosyltransferase [Mycobacterium shinjukuense]